MSMLTHLLERLLGPDAVGHIPPRPDDEHVQVRIDRVVKEIDQIEQDIFTERMRRTWLGDRTS